MQARSDNIEEYSANTAQIIAMTMSHYNNILVVMNDKEALNFIQTYSLNQGLKKFGERGKQAKNKEMSQLHNKKILNLTELKI